jgi:hypothetical protein
MKSSPDIKDEELLKMIEAEIAYEQAFRLRIGRWWWRIYWLLCFLPGQRVRPRPVHVAESAIPRNL